MRRIAPSDIVLSSAANSAGVVPNGSRLGGKGVITSFVARARRRVVDPRDDSTESKQATATDHGATATQGQPEPNRRHVRSAAERGARYREREECGQMDMADQRGMWEHRVDAARAIVIDGASPCTAVENDDSALPNIRPADD